MKNPFRFSILPYFTMGAGGIGLCLRLWLFSATDEKGLLPAGHPADAMLYILTALVLGILFLASREVSTSPFRCGFRPAAEAIGNLAGGLGLLLSALTALLSGRSLLSAIICMAGGILLLFAAFLSYKKTPLPYWLPAAVTVVLMVNTVVQCRVWGSIPQLQLYFFPLLASIFLILTAYHRTTLAAKHGKRKHLAFFSQGALFLCCLSLNSSNWVLYLGMAFWAAAQLLPCYHTKKES